MEPEGLEEFIRALIALMQESELSELEVEREGVRVRLQKQPPPRLTEVVAVNPAATVLPGRNEAAAPPPPTVPETRTRGNLLEVTSPMVGVYYEAPAPDAERFVTVGDEVEPETVVCIIEAMKVMNEIKAETSGRIADILVSNGEAVEFGQVLFLVEPPQE
jgi:acetyl-CoA carboxylase biotin carboxyl carrier protein